MNTYEEYSKKLTTAENAIQTIKSGEILVKGMAISEPPALLHALANRIRANDLKDLKIYYYHSEKHMASTILQYELLDKVKPYCMFLGPAERELIKRGNKDKKNVVYFIPNLFSECDRIFTDYIHVDTFITTVSPMDAKGYFTFGTNNDYASSVARHCKKLIVEVNQHMPRVYGKSFLHVSEVDAIVENHVPLLEVPSKEPVLEDDLIGKQIRDMIPDGATLQMGVGGVPGAVCRYLASHKDLGIHTEALSPEIADLIEKGIATGKRKKIDPRKAVFTFAMGNKRLYKFLHENFAVESHPVSYTNDPHVIAQNDHFISINSILEIDLFGQCNAEHLLGYQYTAVGGQSDFVRGAFRSKEGKSILAFHSTAANGTVSRIVPKLHGPVTDTRMDTHILVTEFGSYDCKGKACCERVEGLIRLAHPKFRDELLAEAKKLNLIC